jgi:hypothetical protein
LIHIRDDEVKKNWDNIKCGIMQWKVLTMKQMNIKEREAT